MSKLILLSVIIMTIALPAMAARERSPKKGLRKTILYICVFNALYLFGLLYLYGRF
jgi:hypothetical protein